MFGYMPHLYAKNAFKSTEIGLFCNSQAGVQPVCQTIPFAVFLLKKIGDVKGGGIEQ